MTDRDLIDRLRAWLAGAIVDAAIRAIDGRPAAVGWATVDLDRAASELGTALGIAADRFLDAAPSPSLGARCRVAADAIAGGVTLVLLEPATEARLAATLARHDEGPAAVWLAVADVPAALDKLRLAGVTVGSEDQGPLGPERFLFGGPIHGPYRLLLGVAGTIHA